MKAADLYKRIKLDFRVNECRDDWSRICFDEFIAKQFQERHIGLLVDNSQFVNSVYSAVFPSDRVLSEIIESGRTDALLFVHHPAVWDLRLSPNVFVDMDRRLLKQLRDRRISVFNLHSPLDRNGPYSTGVTLAKKIGVEVDGEFGEYFGVKVGVFGKFGSGSIQELANTVRLAVGHDVKVYAYGDSSIRNQRVALIGGGGNSVAFLESILATGVNTFVTGITAISDYSRAAHEFATKHKINIIGATHYSTEKFACMEMCHYFETLGLPARFIGDEPLMEDM
jgi:putative NIF3 family GTP cyclohydrolase 1 type 2